MSAINHEEVEHLALADAVIAELGHIAAPEQLARLHEAVVAGDEESLRMIFIERAMHVLPGADPEDLSSYRPRYRLGAFPEEPGERTRGGAMLTGVQIRDRVQERLEIFDQFGEAAKEASPGLREPII